MREKVTNQVKFWAASSVEKLIWAVSGDDDEPPSAAAPVQQVEPSHGIFYICLSDTLYITFHNSVTCFQITESDPDAKENAEAHDPQFSEIADAVVEPEAPTDDTPPEVDSYFQGERMVYGPKDHSPEPSDLEDVRITW